MYSDKNWMIAWNTSDSVPRMEVGPWPDRTGWSNAYDMTTGCCYSLVQDLDDAEQARLLVNEAVNLMFNGIPSQIVLEEFSKIRVWKEMKVDLETISKSLPP